VVFFAMCRHNGDDMQGSDTETNTILRVNVRPVPSDPSKPCSRRRSQWGSGPFRASDGNTVCESDRRGDCVVGWPSFTRSFEDLARPRCSYRSFRLRRRLPWLAGTVTASCAMAGDCVSSFIKRRFGLAPSSMMLGLDQVPESLFPAVACSAYLPLGPLDIALIVLVFSVGELAMSRLFFAVGLRDRPY